MLLLLARSLSTDNIKIPDFENFLENLTGFKMGQTLDSSYL